MELEETNINVKLLTINEILNNKNVLTDMLKENLEVNFSNARNFQGYAEESYEKLKIYFLNEEAIIIGAFEKDIMVGFLWAHEKETFAEKSMHIGHIVVKKNIRAKGIGTKLITFLEEVAIAKNIYKIDLITTLQNENTVKFYGARGYSETRVQFEKELGEINVNK